MCTPWLISELNSYVLAPESRKPRDPTTSGRVRSFGKDGENSEGNFLPKRSVKTKGKGKSHDSDKEWIKYLPSVKTHYQLELQAFVFLSFTRVVYTR